MLKDLPPQFWQLFPLIWGGLFVASGIGMIISGAISYHKTTDKDDVLGFAEAAYYTSSMITMSVGVTDVLVAIFSMVVAFLHKKWLLKVHLVVILIMVFGNLYFFYDIILFFNQDYLCSKNLIKKAVLQFYGDNSVEGGKELVDMVNKIQSETPCCGFSGDENENIFLKTPWHKRINVNVKNINLPDSCCQVHSDDCREVTDMESGRKNGYVHETDCVNELYRVITREMVFVYVEISLSLLMQLVSGIYTLLFLKHGPAYQTA